MTVPEATDRTEQAARAKRPRDVCPDRDKHTVDSTEPSGYINWHEWAAWMTRKGSQQKQCPTCQLWVIWAPTGEELGYDKTQVESLCLGVTGRRGRAR